MNNAGLALVAVRLAVGGGGWVFPKLLLKGVGARDVDDPVAAWLTRMLAVRDLVLGVGVVCTSGDHRRFWLKVGLACDMADLAGGVIAARDRRGVLAKLSPVTGVALGLAALNQDGR